MYTFSWCRLPAVILAFGCASPVAAQLPPVADYFANPTYSGAKLSPSGRYLAIKAASANQYSRLAVIDLDKRTSATIAKFDDADIGEVQWVNEDRLLYTAADKFRDMREPQYAPGLYAVDRNGDNLRRLAERVLWLATKRQQTDLTPTKLEKLLKLQSARTYMLGQPGAQDSDYVYVVHTSFNTRRGIKHLHLLQLNTRTAALSIVAGPPGNVSEWMLDSAGIPRLAVTNDQDNVTYAYRNPATDSWTGLGTYKLYAPVQRNVTPLAVHADGTLYISATSPKRMEAVYTMDPATGKISDQPLIELDGYDFRGELIFSGQQLAGIRYVTDGEGTMWLDNDLKAVQAEIDARLPGTVNLLTPPVRPATPHVLVESYSDRQPRAFLVYNRQTRTLDPVGGTLPHLRAAQMAARTLVRYAARDGLSIPAWLTLPNNADTNLPMVVLVHGGPFMRGSQWGWEAQAQFLASRGYAVLQPEFRGSAGFGAAHFIAGFKQWGLKMQDDVADGAKWAIHQGIANPKRICIAGGSYGGYSALMGLINDPDLYQCGIAWAGPTDLIRMATGGENFDSDQSQVWKRYGIPQLVGDAEKDADRLKATSPLQQAARISKPLLLAHGGADTRVPLAHGTELRDALNASGKKVEWVEYEDEAHGWFALKTRIDFWTRVEAFLERHIGAHP